MLPSTAIRRVAGVWPSWRSVARIEAGLAL
jgi:hypothetical protein